MLLNKAIFKTFYLNGNSGWRVKYFLIKQTVTLTLNNLINSLEFVGILLPKMWSPVFYYHLVKREET